MKHTHVNAVALEACRQLVSTIENTGGVTKHPDGTIGPVADPDWIDLGDAYQMAKAALGAEPDEDSDTLKEARLLAHLHYNQQQEDLCH